jgi:tRNA(Ile)-lysidine synthase
VQLGTSLRPSAALVERFAADLDALVPKGARIGVAVSGGPDSLGLLLLAAVARPGLVQAATVDHALRLEARGEAEMVAALCGQLGIPHAILTAQWAEKPRTAIQERARNLRYGLLGGWAQAQRLAALVTAHHADDQAETFVMRLARGAGVRGLGGMRPAAIAPGTGVALVRPLLAWRRRELEQICTEAGVSPAADPSNEDEQYERVRIRRALAGADWLDPQSVVLSAAHLAEADAALDWAAGQEWNQAVVSDGSEIVYKTGDAPREIRRRIARRAVLELASEGGGADLRGRELDQLLEALAAGRSATLRGVLCSGGKQWRFAKAPARKP